MILKIIRIINSESQIDGKVDDSIAKGLMINAQPTVAKPYVSRQLGHRRCIKILRAKQG